MTTYATIHHPTPDTGVTNQFRDDEVNHHSGNPAAHNPTRPTELPGATH